MFSKTLQGKSKERRMWKLTDGSGYVKIVGLRVKEGGKKKKKDEREYQVGRRNKTHRERRKNKKSIKQGNKN